MGARGRFVVALGLTIASAHTGLAHGATIKVNTGADEMAPNGKCSLREAVEAANTNSAVSGCRKGSLAVDTIELGARRYDLRIASTGENSNANGDLDILGSVRILGAGSARTTISQVATDRIVDVTGANSLEISRTALVAGDVSTLLPAESRGGLVRVAGSAASLELRKAKLTLGTAQAGGAVFVGNASELIASRSLFAENFGFSRGGAIALDDSALLRVKRSVFEQNSALSEVGGVSGGAISHNAATGSSLIANSTFTANRSVASGAGNFTLGGAIQAAGPLEVRGSTFEGNEALAFENGVAEYGAAIYAGGAVTEVVNSTFSDNDAFDTDGAGGAVYAAAGEARLAHVTLVGNLANAGDSLAAGDLASIDVSASLIETSLAGSTCDGSVASGGFNVAEGDDADCGFGAKDLAGVGEGGTGLFELAANGGPTETFALKKSSEAVNFVPTARCLSVTRGRDQRGYARPAGAGCDAGSFERGASKP